MNKILITGTGRSGTSFLVHLLSALGLDTGYTEEQCANELKNACRGGCEHSIEKPYKILKNPEFTLDIEEIVKNHDIDHVIIPIRKLDDVGSSRENNSKNHGGYGGFWNDCETKEEQMIADSKMVYNMIEVLTRNGIPFTTIAFPRMVNDDGLYLWLMLNRAIYKFPSAEVFKETFNRIADIKKVTIK